MKYIGNYDGRKVYELSLTENVPQDKENLYINIRNFLLFNGVRVGRVSADHAMVYEYNIKKAYEVPVLETKPAHTETSSPSGNNNEFFEKIAQEIEKMLKSEVNI